MQTAAIALVGDYSPHVTAHLAIPQARQIANATLNANINFTWIDTASVKHSRSAAKIFWYLAGSW